MNSIRRPRPETRFSVLFVLAPLVLASTGCITIAPRLPQPTLASGEESFVTQPFKLTPNSAFVVRAGGASQDAIGARASTDRAAADLEVLLQRAGVTVRDRQLVEVRLRQATSARDYAQIADDTGVEFVLEISDFREVKAPGYEYFRVSGGKISEGPRPGFEVSQWEVTVDIVRVRDNTRAGRLVGAANMFTMARDRGQWPFADPTSQNPVESYEHGEMNYQLGQALAKVQGITCNSNFATNCRIADASIAVRDALGQVAKQLASYRVAE